MSFKSPEVILPATCKAWAVSGQASTQVWAWVSAAPSANCYPSARDPCPEWCCMISHRSHPDLYADGRGEGQVPEAGLPSKKAFVRSPSSRLALGDGRSFQAGVKPNQIITVIADPHVLLFSLPRMSVLHPSAATCHLRDSPLATWLQA